MRDRIILLETSTSLCSVALAEEGRIVAARESDTPRAHASMTAVFVQEILQERGLKVSDCDAVCLSMGPGSYTGLRVGSSTAKGLCFGGGIPLLAVSTLDVLVAQALEEGLPDGCSHIVPMIDARRMEVYSALYSADGQQLSVVAPQVADENFLSQILRSGDCPSGGVASRPLPEGPLPLMEPRVATSAGETVPATKDTSGILFIGDGAGKCEAVLGGERRWFRQECPRATSMLKPALRELKAGSFRDTAYFEPFYLKDFVATVSKKLF